jgi:predicted O-methyltransferase YrrM
LRQTPVPFDAQTSAALTAALAPVAPGAVPRAVSPSFPEESDLLACWSTVRGVVKLLEPHNRPDDKYFRSVRLEAQLREGRVRISKDLFAVWLASHHAPRRILEIGARTGRSLALTLFAHADPGGASTVVVDAFVEMGSPALLHRNLERLKLDSSRVVVLVGRSDALVPELLRQEPKPAFDYVLVDGSHDAADALADLQLVESLVAPGGYVLFDDIGTDTYGLLPVWEEWLDATQGAFASRVYNEPAAFAVARRKPFAASGAAVD